MDSVTEVGPSSSLISPSSNQSEQKDLFDFSGQAPKVQRNPNEGFQQVK